MKHVDAKALEQSARGKDGRVDLSAENALLRDILNQIEPAVIFWDAGRICRFHTDNARDLLELPEDGLRLGMDLKSYIMGSLSRREISAETATYALDTTVARRNHRTLRTTKSRRRLLASAQHRDDGGLIITYTDVTEFKNAEAALAKEKTRAEQAEQELSRQLERLTAEQRHAETRRRELERLSLVAAHAKDLIVISSASNRIEWANETYRRRNGLDLEMDLIGKSARDVLVSERTDPDTLTRIDDAIRNRRSVTVTLLCHPRTGADYWMEQEITPVFNDRGEHTNFIMVGRDVTEKLEADRRAEEARRFEVAKRDESRLLVEFNEWLQSSDSLDELFEVVSSYLARLLPGSEGAIFVYSDNREILEAVCAWPHPGALAHLEPSDCWALRRGRGYHYGANTVDFPCEHVRRAHREQLPDQYLCLPIVAHGDTVGLLHIRFSGKAGMADQDTQKLANFCAEQISLAIANIRLRDQLREQSMRDPLTGLFNRRFFFDQAARTLSRCKASSTAAALISLDVDHFKKFNDRHGHDAGDTVLRAVADVLRALFREADTPCRLGGEEFVILLSGVDAAAAMERAEALRRAIETRQVVYGGEGLRVTASLGVAMFPDDATKVEDLLRHADAALYAAKDGGRNCVKRL